jgi:glutamate synthase domain-containing protein 2
MSYGSLSKNAVLALNGGAKAGNFAHNTGEGGISPYHQQPGGDLIWQIGTGYFGCRTQDGKFDADMFKQKAQLDQVKMIELKLSQGAKPGHGGMLPGKKVTAEVAQIRNVPIGQDVNSPPGHSAFSTPLEMMEFIQKLKELSGGKPVGIKLSLGHKYEFIAMAKAMLKSEIHPDFIVVDGSEGGTGAAPLEFTNHIGTPGLEALHFVHQTLRGFNLREKIKIISTGKISSGFGILKQIALGADLTYSARSMMLALGCIQALRCNSNVCPAGVATQKPSLVAGLHVGDKTTRVKNFHQGTIKSLAEIIGAMGLNHTNELNAHQLFKRDSDGKVKSFTELYPKIERGSLLSDPPQAFEYLIKHTSELSFQLSV